MRWGIIATLVCCCLSACNLQTNFFNKNKTTHSNHLPHNLDSTSLAKLFAGDWVFVFETDRLPQRSTNLDQRLMIGKEQDSEASHNEFKIQFDFRQRLRTDYLFKHLTKRPPFWQTKVRHGTWKINAIKRNDDGTYRMNLNLHANRNVEEITLVVDKLTRNSFEAYLETNPSLNFHGTCLRHEN